MILEVVCPKGNYDLVFQLVIGSLELRVFPNTSGSAIREATGHPFFFILSVNKC